MDWTHVGRSIILELQPLEQMKSAMPEQCFTNALSMSQLEAAHVGQYFVNS